MASDGPQRDAEAVGLSHFFPGPSQKPFPEPLQPQTCSLTSTPHRPGSQVCDLWGGASWVLPRTLKGSLSALGEKKGRGKLGPLPRAAGASAKHSSQTTRAQRARWRWRKALDGVSLRGGGGAGPQPAERGVWRDPKRQRLWAEQGAKR